MIGFDVSSHNLPGMVPWAEAQFAFVRCSHGLGTDVVAAEHLARAEGAGVALRGVYHYLKGNTPGYEQADHFLRVVKLLEGGGPPLALALDLEDLPPPAQPWSRKVYAQRAADFLSRMPRPCAIYGSPGYLASLQTHERLEGPLWAAHWGVSAPMVPPPWKDWTIHQFSTTGGTLDRNRMRGDAGDWCRIFGLPLPVPHPADLHAGRVAEAVQRATGGHPERPVMVDEGPVVRLPGEGDSHG